VAVPDKANPHPFIETASKGARLIMKIAAWNVNSLKVRLPQLLDFLATRQPDAVCLQETKLTDDAFPVAELEAAGYRAVFSGQKTYNGVAIVSRNAATDVQIGIPGYADEQKRVIAATVEGVRLVQVRDKRSGTRSLLAKVEAALRLAAPYDALVLVNDRLDVALAANADGVHLGQDDLPVAAARALAPDLVIGASSHGLEQALAEADPQRIGKAGHTIKGAFLNLGMGECAKLAMNIEEKGRNGGAIDELRTLIENLRHQLSHLLE